MRWRRRLVRGRADVPSLSNPKGMTLSTDEPIDAPLKIDPKVARRMIFGMLGLVGIGVLVYNLAKPEAVPPPAAIANDPLLVRGREIYLARCASCHG
ncbi:hypothetical protein ACYOEI_33315, partial [Singulisphaera rosea]